MDARVGKAEAAFGVTSRRSKGAHGGLRLRDEGSAGPPHDLDDPARKRVLHPQAVTGATFVGTPQDSLYPPRPKDRAQVRARGDRGRGFRDVLRKEQAGEQGRRQPRHGDSPSTSSTSVVPTGRTSVGEHRTPNRSTSSGSAGIETSARERARVATSRASPGAALPADAK